MATIIKPNSPHYPSGTALRDVAYRLTDMDSQATEYLQKVRHEAEKIVQQARKEAETIRRDAQEAGRAAAEAAIEQILDAKVSHQMKTLLPAVSAAVVQIEDARHDWLRHWEHVGLTLAAAIAERIVRSELTRRPEISIEWLREALQLAAGSADVTIRLSPCDEATLARHAQEVAEAFAPTANTRIVADDAISPGGCRIDTEFGAIDQQVETQLARIVEELGGAA